MNPRYGVDSGLTSAKSGFITNLMQAGILFACATKRYRCKLKLAAMVVFLPFMWLLFMRT